MKPKGGMITKVESGSPAEKAGLKPGDRIIAVNEERVNDLIDLTFALSDESAHIQIENELGEQHTHYFQKRFGDAVGIELESAVFDSVRQCANQCVFCFIDQMPKGMRASLYVKDDDYRMSFLHGNFITLTNMGPRDWERIRALHLSPLYISLHTLNGDLRSKMMKHKSANTIKEALHRLEDYGIDFHGQIVMCPGYNDGDDLENTLKLLLREFTNALDVAIVPVGLTRFRDDLATLTAIDKDKAIETINRVSKWQGIAKREKGYNFAYLADEFYLKAEVPFPLEEEYDGFHLLEDGIGMGRKFASDWEAYPHKKHFYEEKMHIALVTGTSIHKTIKKQVDSLIIENLKIDVLGVENLYFGTTINVTGLLTYTDIVRTVKEEKKRGVNYDAVIVPGVCLRKGEPVFLDDKTIEDMELELMIPIRVCHFATDLLEQLYHWR